MRVYKMHRTGQKQSETQQKETNKYEETLTTTP